MEIDENQYISIVEAITIHVLLMKDWNETRFGIDRKDLLESALNRPKHLANYENADIIKQAASLCFGLVKNHPFVGGNKRTATLLTEIFLDINGFELTASDDEIVEMVLKVESDVWKVDEIESWLRERVENLIDEVTND